MDQIDVNIIVKKSDRRIKFFFAKKSKYATSETNESHLTSEVEDFEGSIFSNSSLFIQFQFVSRNG